MNQYPPDNPPSYDYAISDQGQSASVIGEAISAQPVGHKAYPILPSAPLQEQYQNYGSISEVIQSQPVATNVIILPANACPICRIGLLDDDFSCLGICLAIFCFPIGILCCLVCKNKRCSNCGAII